MRWGSIPILLSIVLIGCGPADFDAAKEMVRRQKFYNAMELYLSFVRENPNHRRAPEALFEVGNIQETILNEYDKAVLTYRRLVGHYPIGLYTLRAQQRVAEIEKNQFGNYEQGIIDYEKLLHANPESGQAASYQFEIAQCYTLLHNYDQAAREFAELVKKYPKFERLDEVYFQMGNNAYIAGRYTEALAMYQKVIHEYPDSTFRVQAIFGLGSTYEEMDEFDKARAEYESVVKEYPSPKVIQIRLNRLAVRQKKKSSVAPGAVLRGAISSPRQPTPTPAPPPVEEPVEPANP